MNSRSTIVLKEARALFWPWLAVICAGTLWSFMPFFSLASASVLGVLYSAGFALGIPLLATIPLGNEFQHRTLSLLLSQPVDRMKIWNTKSLVLATAILSSGTVYAMSQPFLPGSYRISAFLAVLWLIITVCSANFWTLVAQSIVGGLTLNLMQIVPMTIVDQLAQWAAGPRPSPAAARTVLLFEAAVAILYAAAMLWLGRRKLARFQAAGLVAGDDLLLSLPAAIRQALTGWLRCRPTGAFANLFRKDLRLLWPVWLLTIFCLIGLICLTPFQSVRYAPNIAAIIVLLYSVVSLLLTGSISMGEERGLGTQSWQLTMPVSADIQWLVKIFTVVSTVFTGLVVLVYSAQAIFGAPFTVLIPGSLESVARLFLLSLLSLAGFWCACGVNGTVRAVLFTIPAIGAITLAQRFAFEMDFLLMRVPFINLAFWKLGPLSFGYATYQILPGPLREFNDFFFFWGPALVTGLVQSRRYFRREVRENTSAFIRYLSWPVIVVFVVTFCLEFPQTIAFGTWQLGASTVREIHRNVRQLKLDLTDTDATRPRQLGAQEVANVISTDKTRRALENSTIVVFAGNSVLLPDKVPFSRNSISTTVHFANGLDCTATDWFNLRTGAPVPNPWVNCKIQTNNSR